MYNRKNIKSVSTFLKSIVIIGKTLHIYANVCTCIHITHIHIHIVQIKNYA